MRRGISLPDWAHWNSDPGRPAWTVGIEEEVMLLDPADWSLAHRIDDLMPALTPDLAEHVTPETHACTLELATGVHATVAEATAELSSLRAALAAQLGKLGLRPAVAGTHPSASTERTQVSGGARYQMLERGLRDLARREPTFALHVHVGVPLPELAIAAFDRIRGHLPLILALSANSPYWRGRDSGMASMRTPLFQAFPRSGIPRRFGSYPAYVEAIDVLLRADAFPEPTFIWWDVRLQPRFGTIEVRIADAQTKVADVAALAALIQVLVRLEATEPLTAGPAAGRARGARRESLPRRPRRDEGPPDRRAGRGSGARRAPARRSRGRRPGTRQGPRMRARAGFRTGACAPPGRGATAGARRGARPRAHARGAGGALPGARHAYAGSACLSPGRIRLEPNETRSSAPPPGALAASTLPPCASAAWRTIARPRPEPGSARASSAR